MNEDGEKVNKFELWELTKVLSVDIGRSSVKFLYKSKLSFTYVVWSIKILSDEVDVV